MSLDGSSIRITTLPNGMRVATDSMAHVETVTVGVWVHAGTRHEPAEINGVSHLLEHMAFKGTERRTAQGLAEEVEAVGGYMNAYTSREQTVYYLKLMADDLELGVDVLADILQHSVFDPDELERERSVVVQEILSADDMPEDVVFDHFQIAAYPDQGLGRPILGPVEIVRGMPRQAIAGYMRRQYAAGRMVLAAAGKVDHDRLVDLATRFFDALPATEPRDIDPAAYVGGDLRRRKDHLGQVHLTLGFPGIGYAHEDYHASQLLATLLGGGMSSRLFQEVREKRGLCYNVYSFASPFEDHGLFGIYVAAAEDEIAEAMPVIVDETLGVADRVGEEELRRSFAQLKAGLLMGLESTTARAERLAQSLIIHGRAQSVAETVAELQMVTPDQVSRLAARLLGGGAPTLAALGPIARVQSYDDLRRRFG
ncbi:pitrilysin family protein [Tistrella mobilis]|uniref:Peptidase M16 n=1 Tax=Tistrella mobilis TaxID=171437 RepID=A0A162LHL7_9PROT|nr:pitrilysin family protein [Tistrella mobilis]KYO55027.1 peptidase M16 [Tistrella mobilis]